MPQCMFSVRRRLRLFEAVIRAVREEYVWLRMQELQTRFAAATENRDRLRWKLDRRLEIIE
jgi:hypothetical protein